MRTYLRICLVLTSLVIFTVSAPRLRADGIAFNVTPMIADLTAEAGTTQTGVITLSDNSAADSAPLRVKVAVKDWTLTVSGDPHFFEAGTTPGSCASWLTVTPQELSVPSGQPQVVRYTLAVPPGAQGSYHAIVFLTTAPLPSHVNNRNVLVSGCIGCTLYVQVGPCVRRAKITALTMTANNVTLTLQNTGSSYLRLKGVVKIAGSDGEVVQQITIPGAVVLPGENGTRTITLPLSSAAATGSYTATAILDYGGDVLLGARANVVVP